MGKSKIKSQTVSKQNPKGCPSSRCGDAGSFVTAFELGRALNQLSWHMQQAALLGKPEHCKRTAALFEELATRLRGWASARRRDSIEAAVHHEEEKWREFYGSEAHSEWLFQLNEEIQTYMSDGINLDEARQSALSDLSWLSNHHRIRSIALELLPEEYIPAFTLGDYLDQLLRPADTYAFLYEPSGQEGVAVACAEDNYVANRSRREAEIEPEQKWKQKLERRWTEAHLALPLPLGRRNAGSSSRSLKKLVPDIENAAFKGLEAQDRINFASNGPSETTVQASPPSQPPISPARQLRVAVDVQTEIVTKDGVHHKVSRGEAIVLAEVIAAGGHVVSGTDIRKRHPELEGAKLTPFKKSINKRLGRLINGKAGSGYSLDNQAWRS